MRFETSRFSGKGGVGRSFGFLISHISYLIVLLLLSACGKTDLGKSKPPFLYTGPLIESTNVTTLFSDSAQLKFRVEAPLEQKYENGDIWYRRGVKITFFGPEGEVRNTLRGDVAQYDKQKNLYHVTGDVQVQSAVKKEKVNSEELYYDQNAQRIYTEKFVRIETATEILTGTGLTANRDFSRYTILHPAGDFLLKENSAAPTDTARPAPVRQP